MRLGTAVVKSGLLGICMPKNTERQARVSFNEQTLFFQSNIPPLLPPNADANDRAAKAARELQTFHARARDSTNRERLSFDIRRDSPS